MLKETPEHLKFKVLEHWKPKDKLLEIEELTGRQKENFPLFSYLYAKTQKEYLQFPKRKDGSNPFLHPINLVWDLRQAKVHDDATLCAALIHDLIEERVDIYKIKNNISENQENGIKNLDNYELKQFSDLKKELVALCRSNKISPKKVDEIIEILYLLTRHKRHFYYRSISAIFNCRDKKLKEKAIQIKLADRIHNIQSIACFREEMRIYQCFKNLFVLNNTKKYFFDRYGEKPRIEITPTEKMFKKCAKATYDAFLTVCHLCLNKRIQKIESMLQLAFKKFAWEKKGWWTITAVDEKETHPMKLYQGIIKKYDARLHQEWKVYDLIKEKEIDYCRKFFADYGFRDKQFRAILDYKDSYALKEVVARLLYKPTYFLSGFACSGLCHNKGKYCQRCIKS